MGTMTNITYGNGVFVAVSSDSLSRVMTSANGIEWTARDAPAATWRSVTYGNGLFVAVAVAGDGANETVIEKPCVMTSPDGIVWTVGNQPAQNWTTVTYGNGLFVAMCEHSYGLNCTVMTSPDGLNWEHYNSQNTPYWRAVHYGYAAYLSCVTYGNGQFVAVVRYDNDSISNQSVLTSPDGANWTVRNAPNNYWSSITYGNGLFLAVSLYGENRVMTSPDGINWTERPAAEQNEWLAITYGNGLFVAMAYQKEESINLIMTSTDGINWATRTPPVDNYWFGVTYGNGLFVAVGSGGNVHSVITSSFSAAVDAPVITAITPRNNSANVVFTQTASVYASAVINYEYSLDSGTTWTARSPASYLSPMKITGLNNGTTYNVKIRAINAGGTSGSSNFISVTPALGTVAGAPAISTITPINTGGLIKFASPASDGGSDITNYEHSTDGGFTWVAPSPPVKISPLIIISSLTNSITYPIQLRAVNAAGNGAVSALADLTPTLASIGVDWIVQSQPKPMNSVTYGNGLFVAVTSEGPTNNVTTSSDGVTWTQRTAPPGNWSTVTYGNHLFVAVANYGTHNVMTSHDGIQWTVRTAPACVISVAYGNGLFVAVGYDDETNKHVITSSDGIGWTLQNSPDERWYSVTHGNGLFVAVSIYGNGNTTYQVMTSPDGQAWTGRTAPMHSWNSVTYGDGRFVAVSYDGTDSGSGCPVMTSLDGLVWTQGNSVPNGYWYNVTYGSGLFVAVAYGGPDHVMTSPDGMDWTPRTAPPESWSSITYGNGMFVAVAGANYNGSTNLVLTSSFSVST